MDYHEIVMQGPFYLEEVTSLPSISDEKRMVYYNGSIYFNDGTEWKNMLYADKLGGYAASVFSQTSHTHATYLEIADNLSDLNNIVTARTNLGLGTMATQSSGDYALSSHNHDTIYTKKANNLSDVSNISTARSNLGLKNNAIITYTISTANPSGGSNGDIWYKIAS